MPRHFRYDEKTVYEMVRGVLSKNCEDYKNDEASNRLFFSKLQNKLLYAVTQSTACGIIKSRCKRQMLNVGLTTFSGKGGPTLKDVEVAKNYLKSYELECLGNLAKLIFANVNWDTKHKDEASFKEDWLKKIDELFATKCLPIWNGKESLNRKMINERAKNELIAYRKLHPTGKKKLQKKA